MDIEIKCLFSQLFCQTSKNEEEYPLVLKCESRWFFSWALSGLFP